MKKKYIAPVLDVIPMHDELPFLVASRIGVKDKDGNIEIPEIVEESEEIKVDSKKNNLWDTNLWSD